MKKCVLYNSKYMVILHSVQNTFTAYIGIFGEKYREDYVHESILLSVQFTLNNFEFVSYNEAVTLLWLFIW